MTEPTPYDDEYRDMTLESAIATISDLEDWSVHNGDKWLDMILTIKDTLVQMKKGNV